MQTAGRSWTNIVGSQNLSQGAVPLPHARFGARVARPNSVVLHTQAFKDITASDVMDAVLKCVRQDTIKCVQDQPFHLRGERVIAQELDMPTLLVKVLYAPSEISNQTIAATLAKYGKIVKVDREMYRDWSNVETGLDIVGKCLYVADVANMDIVLLRTVATSPGRVMISVQTVENNKSKAEEDVSIPDEGVKVPEDSTDQRVSDMGGSPEERTKKTDKGKKKKRKKHNKL
ncbi:Hypothetical predicted protein [Paramuricea clavata]|uniref:Uncharacterized protein n=1 Tax=Paramuricea clavata TaxID=317549 RepID=A0A7D9IMZ3_PARCT|nr:Hypothetical predicted protein [Paramuricea clavata]